MTTTKCDNCPSKDGCVTAEPTNGQKILVVIDHPSIADIDYGRVFTGFDGAYFANLLKEVGLDRKVIKVVPVVACAPPGNDLDLLLHKQQKANKKAKEPKPNAIQACSERFKQDIKGFKYIVCFGKHAAQEVLGRVIAPMTYRGACFDLSAENSPTGVAAKVAVTLDLNFVIENPIYKDVVSHDFGRAMRFFNRSLRWKSPEICYATTVEQVEEELTGYCRANSVVAYDLETDNKNAQHVTGIRCIGIGNHERAMVIGFKSVPDADDFGFVLDQVVMQPIRETVIDFLEKKGKWANRPPLIGHNANNYDAQVCKRIWGCTPLLDGGDTLLKHVLADNEMPHGLGFCVSRYTDSTEAWKADHKATTSETNEELQEYCAKDVTGTARIDPVLTAAMHARKQGHLYEREHMLMRLGAEMQVNGLRLDFNKMQAKTNELKIKIDTIVEKFAEAAPGVSLSSPVQLSRFFFDRLGLPPYSYSEKTGEPKLDFDSLVKMELEYNLPPEQVELVRLVRRHREFDKLMNTYAIPLVNLAQLADDKRLHPSYSRLPATGRYSSSDPNAQNIPVDWRDAIIPRKGYTFIGADEDQLELRYIAEEAKAVRLLKSINDGFDPHNETMEIVYGVGIWKLPGAPSDRKKKGTDLFKAVRDILKNVRYAWQYAAAVKRIREQVISAQDENGTLIYGDKTIETIREAVNGLNKADPEIPAWWVLQKALFQKQGYIADSLWGRRRYFRNGMKLNELVNHPIQTGGVNVVHEATIEIFYGEQPWFATEAVNPVKERLPVSWFANQCHDSLLFEVPISEAERVKDLVTRAMTRVRKKNPLVVYSSGAKVGDNWKDV